jgi:inosine-uridine nucleoside N-ribohydrolase
MSLLTLGPPTNIAELLEESPALGDKIDALYIMGGAVDVEGNVGNSGVDIDNPYAEWNIYVDPQAAKIVLDSGVPVTLVPLDATNDAPLTLDFVERLAADSETPQAKFAAQVMDNLRELIGFGYYFWDPFAAAVLVDERLTSVESAGLTVVIDEGPESGRIVRAGDGGLARYATSADLERFEELLIDTLNGRAD